MRRLTSRSVTQLCSRNVILGSNGLKTLGLVSSFRKPQLATLATWSNFGGSAKMSISLRLWWTRGDSNPRPPRCERGALPAELLAHEQQKNFSRGCKKLPTELLCGGPQFEFSQKIPARTVTLRRCGGKISAQPWDL